MELERGRPGRPSVGAGVPSPGTCVTLPLGKGSTLLCNIARSKRATLLVQKGCTEQRGAQRDSVGTLDLCFESSAF